VDPDPWIAADKAQHVAFAAALVLVAHLLLRRTTRVGWLPALTVAVLLSCVGGIGKEAGDHLGWWPGRLSARDLVADLIGTCTAAAAVAAAERRQQRYARQRYARLPTTTAALAPGEADVELGLVRSGED